MFCLANYTDHVAPQNGDVAERSMDTRVSVPPQPLQNRGSLASIHYRESVFVYPTCDLMFRSSVRFCKSMPRELGSMSEAVRSLAAES